MRRWYHYTFIGTHDQNLLLRERRLGAIAVGRLGVGAADGFPTRARRRLVRCSASS